jgi:ankyrin repeat protein
MPLISSFYPPSVRVLYFRWLIGLFFIFQLSFLSAGVSEELPKPKENIPSADPFFSLLSLPLGEAKKMLPQFSVQQLNQAGANGMTPLAKLCLINRWDLAEILIQAGASATFVSSQDNTVLHLLARITNQMILTQLIAAGAKVDALNVRGESPLFLACTYGSLEAVDAFLKAGADVNLMSSKNQITALMQACRLGLTDIVKRLIEAGADLSITPEKTEVTALRYAVLSGNDELIGLLVRAGAKIY